jgi:hypothetical protein
MDIALHRGKIAKLDRVRARLDPVDDIELWMAATLQAAIHGLNAALHHVGLTQPGTYFVHQIPGLYVEAMPAAPWHWKRVFAAPGDVLHLGLPPIVGAIPPSIVDALPHLKAIESRREPVLRGAELPTSDVACEIDRAYWCWTAALEAILSDRTQGDR